MKVLIYEDCMDATPPCIYETDTADILDYALEAIDGQRTKDIIYDCDGRWGYTIDMKAKRLYCDDDTECGFDIAIDALRILKKGGK